MDINSFLATYGRKLKGREWYYGIDNNQCSASEWDTSKLKILVCFFSDGVTRSVSSTFTALNNIIRTELPEVFVDCSYIPMSDDLDLHLENNVPVMFGNVSHRDPKEYDMIFFSNSIIAERFNFPLFYKTTGIPLGHHGRMKDENIPIIVYGGVASTYGESVYGKFLLPDGTEDESLVDITNLGAFEERGPQFVNMYLKNRELGRTKMDFIKDACLTFNNCMYPCGYEVVYDGEDIISNKVKYDWVRPFVTPFEPESVTGPNFERKVIALDGTSADGGELQISRGALTKDSVVRTNKGLSLISDLVGVDISDVYVQNSTQMNKLLRVWDNGVQAVIKLVLEDGTTLELTHDHECEIIRDGKFEWLQAMDIIQGDTLTQVLGSDLPCEGDYKTLTESLLSHIKNHAKVSSDFNNIGFDKALALKYKEILNMFAISSRIFYSEVTHLWNIKLENIEDVIKTLSTFKFPEKTNKLLEVKSVYDNNKEMTYDLTIDVHEKYLANSISVHNCSGYSSCNFSVTGDTLIITEDGIDSIKNLVGTTPAVLSYDYEQSLHVSKTRMEEVYIVRLSDGTQLKCSGNHIWLVFDSVSGSLKELKTIELDKKHIVLKKLGYRIKGKTVIPSGQYDNLEPETEAASDYMCEHLGSSIFNDYIRNCDDFDTKLVSQYTFLNLTNLLNRSNKQKALFLESLLSTYDLNNTVTIHSKSRKLLDRIQMLLLSINIVSKTLFKKETDLYYLTIPQKFSLVLKRFLENPEISVEELNSLYDYTTSVVPYSDKLGELLDASGCDDYVQTLTGRYVNTDLLEKIAFEKLPKVYQLLLKKEFIYTTVHHVIKTSSFSQMYDIGTADTNHILYDGILTHNCVSKDTLLSVKDGDNRVIQNIESLVRKSKGKRILDQSGYVYVKKVVSNGVKELFELSLDGGHTIRATKDHAFKVYSNKVESYKKLEDLTTDDLLVLKVADVDYESINIPAMILGFCYMVKELETNKSNIFKDQIRYEKYGRSPYGTSINYEFLDALVERNLGLQRSTVRNNISLCHQYDFSKVENFRDLDLTQPGKEFVDKILPQGPSGVLSFYFGMLNSYSQRQDRALSLKIRDKEFSKVLQNALMFSGVLINRKESKIKNSSSVTMCLEDKISSSTLYNIFTHPATGFSTKLQTLKWLSVSGVDKRLPLYKDYFPSGISSRIYLTSKMFPKIEEDAICRKYVKDNVVLKRFVSSESIGLDTVYDVVNSETHNFIANGFSISNCSEGNIIGPWREMVKEEMDQKFHDLRRNTAINAISFFSFNSNFLSYFKDALAEASKIFQSTSLIAMRSDEIGTKKDTLDFAKLFKLRRITFAVEGFGDRLRNILLNKNLDFSQLREAAKAAFENRLMEIKLMYILTGHETREDWDEGIKEIQELVKLRTDMGANTQIRVSITPLVIYSNTGLRYLERRMAKASLYNTRDLDYFFEEMKKIGVRGKTNGRGFGTFMEQMCLDGGRKFTQTIIDFTQKYNHAWYGSWVVSKYRAYADHVVANHDIEKLFSEKDKSWIDVNYRVHHQMYGSMLVAEEKIKNNTSDKYCLKTHANCDPVCHAAELKKSHGVNYIVPADITKLVYNKNEERDKVLERAKEITELQNNAVKFSYETPSYLEELGIKADSLNVGNAKFSKERNWINYMGCSHCATKEQVDKRVHRNIDTVSSLDTVRENIATNIVRQTIRVKAFLKPEYDFISFSSFIRIAMSRVFMNSDVDYEKDFHSITNTHTAYWMEANESKNWGFGSVYFDVNFKSRVDVAKFKESLPKFNKYLECGKLEDACEVLDKEDSINMNDLGFHIFYVNVPYHQFQSKLQNWDGKRIKYAAKSMQGFSVEEKTDTTLIQPYITSFGSGTLGVLCIKNMYSPWLFLSTILGNGMYAMMNIGRVCHVLNARESDYPIQGSTEFQLIDRLNSKYLNVGKTSFMKKLLAYGKTVFKDYSK